MPLFLNDKSSASHSFPAHPQPAARENMKRHAQETLEKKVEEEKKKKDNFNNTRKRKFSGCNLINNAKRRLGGGEIGPREQISQHSWGRPPFGRVSKAHNTAFFLHASANSN